MQKVITINLNGQAYQLDESAYERLRAYLDDAALRLKDNPDRAEILADFEQAIADKCRRFLGPNKTVVTAVEMEKVLEEMGPVEGDGEPGAHAETPAGGAAEPGSSAHARPHKRFYRIPADGMFGGVCAGAAAYFGVDVVIVRIVFVGLTAASFGWAIVGYWVLVFIVPEARTSEERAAAAGERFDAQGVIDEAKRRAADLKANAGRTRAEWRRQWKGQRRRWKAQGGAWRRDWRARAGGAFIADDQSPASVAGHPAATWAAIAVPVFTVMSITCVAMLIAAIASLLNTGGIYGWPLPPRVPVWAAIFVLIALFQLVTGPLRAARHASYYAWGRSYAFFAVWDGVFGTALTALVVWLLYRHMPPVDDFGGFMAHLPDAFRALVQDAREWTRTAFESLTR